DHFRPKTMVECCPERPFKIWVHARQGGGHCPVLRRDIANECSCLQHKYTQLGTLNTFFLVVYPWPSGGTGAVSDLSLAQQLRRLARGALLRCRGRYSRILRPTQPRRRPIRLSGGGPIGLPWRRWCMATTASPSCSRLSPPCASTTSWP